MMHVAYCLDRNYERHFLASAWSLVMNLEAPPQELTIHALVLDPSADLQRAVDRMRRKFGVNLAVYPIAAEMMDRLAGSPTRSALNIHLNLTAYLRLLIPEVLPVSVERVLYLDSDTIVLEDVGPLLETELNGAAAAGVRDGEADMMCSKAGHAEYINTGVLLMDLVAWRREGLGEKCIDLAKSGARNIYYADQCCINWVLSSQKGLLDNRWNRFIRSGDEPVAPGAIVHYVGAFKPWQAWFSNPMGRHYWAYAEASGWPAPLQAPATPNQFHFTAKKLAAEGDFQGAIEMYEVLVRHFGAMLAKPA